MNHFLNGVVRAVAETFDLPEPIMEIGSYQVDGQESVANLRNYFAGKEYIGVDMRSGPGVDCVADVESLPHNDASIGTVVAVSTFEHVPRFWRGFEEIYRVLRPTGVFLVSCPFYFHIHNYPSDYWRFTPESLELLLDRYPTKIVGWHGPQKRPAGVWAIAFREACEPVTRSEFDQYRSLLHQYAKEPRSWRRSFRYRLGRLLCGHGPFAPYLDHDRWETECRTTKAH